MSSELMIHQGTKRLTGRVNTLDGSGYTVVGLTFLNDGDDYTGSAERITLYLENDRLLEALLVFNKLAQDLAALLPGVGACCKCEPRRPDDQCPTHGFGAYELRRDEEADECSGSATCVDHPESEDTIPAESECGPACDTPTEAHCMDCACFEAGLQAGYETERRPLSY